MPQAVLSAAETAALIPFPALVVALRLAVAQAAKGAIACPNRQVVPLADGAVILSMVATAHDIAVHKLITVVPNNGARGLPTIAGQVSVLDAATGAIELTLDGATVTGRRTAALSMLGIATLLGRAPRHVLLVGTGTQTLNHGYALAALHPAARISIAGRTRSAAEGFIAEHGIAASAADLANMDEDVDVVITGTTSKQPVYLHAARAGRLIIAVGAFKPDAAEIAPATVLASRVFVDDPEGAHHEAGDLLQAGVDWTEVQGIAQAIGRPAMADSEAVLFKTVGCAAWDLAAARVALSLQRVQN
ncbi:delta(1)-pyrroline-2-carboxylate reductase family protein [Pseudoduganella sp. LjRoot289]|uniref:bifunctional Delta(1)-pyrroline-2-carboxylate/Delta(1)-piperideine-2- carboxylate reductase n=1 Tax=Pseudoduganella sp. LjRoot289 TaxID=3342314 RepID=UPI003ED15015